VRYDYGQIGCEHEGGDKMLTAKMLSKFGLLVMAWIAYFYVLTFLTQLTFTPWDGAIDWPAVGTWQRSLNDFFASDPGRLILSVPVILLSIYLTLSYLRLHPDRINHLVGLSWLFIPILLLTWFAAITLDNAVHPYPPVAYDPNYRGFHLTIIPGIALIGLCVFWLLGWQKILSMLPANNS
jgi:hypothetical protein